MLFWNQQEIGNKVSVRTVLPVQSNLEEVAAQPGVRPGERGPGSCVPSRAVSPANAWRYRTNAKHRTRGAERYLGSIVDDSG